MDYIILAARSRAASLARHMGMKAMKSVIPAALLVLLISGCATPLNVQLDDEVRRLCAIDGGIKVYEKVTLPADRFDKYGQINFYRPTQGENALGSEYLVKDTTDYLLKGEYEKPAMWRYQFQVFRRSDGKLLGEQVGYVRRGGDLPGPSHPSSFTCPEYGNQSVLKRIFATSNLKGEMK